MTSNGKRRTANCSLPLSVYRKKPAKYLYYCYIGVIAMFFDLSLSILDLPQSEKEHTAKRNQMFITGWTENTELIISEIDGVPVSISRRIFPITTI